MWIKGFIHQSEDEAIFGNVHIVADVRRSAGRYVGYMELSNSDEIVLVKEHPAGGDNGMIVKEEVAV